MSMIENIKIRNVKFVELKEFLQTHDYNMQKLSGDVVVISREELEVFVKVNEDSLFFEIEIGDISQEKTVELYEDLLDLNTEILPVSLGIDKSSTKHSRLVLVESREFANLDDNELLSVLRSMDIALAKTKVILNKHLS